MIKVHPNYQHVGQATMYHRMGGPTRKVDVYRNGNTIFIDWGGLRAIMWTTGALSDKRDCQWVMQSADLLKYRYGTTPTIIPKNNP